MRVLKQRKPSVFLFIYFLWGWYMSMCVCPPLSLSQSVPCTICVYLISAN